MCVTGSRCRDRGLACLLVAHVVRDASVTVARENGRAVTGPLARRFGIGTVVVLGYVPSPADIYPRADGPQSVVIGAEFLSSLGVMILDIGAGSLQTAANPASRLSLVKGAQRTVNYGMRPIGALLGGSSAS